MYLYFYYFIDTFQTANFDQNNFIMENGKISNNVIQMRNSLLKITS